jgi:hypothetical protein
LNYRKVRLKCNNRSRSRSSFNVLALPLRLTIESELFSLVCFFGPLEEDRALFGVVALEAMRANGVEELE